MHNDKFMDIAIKMAQKAYKCDEVPIGAVIVNENGEIISKAYNKREKTQNAIHHAEIIAIEKACKKLGSWRLDNLSMYVTLTPCPMCAGAIVNARLKTVYYGADSKNDNQNLCEKILDDVNRLNHRTKLVYLQNLICENILSHYFQNKRQINKK